MLKCKGGHSVKGYQFYWENRPAEDSKLKIYFDKFVKSKNDEINELKLKVAALEEKNSDLVLDNESLQRMLTLSQSHLTLSENALKNANKRIGGLIDKRV